MSIQAQTPDGVVHQFPDGTPDAVVDKVIKDYVAATPQASGAKENVFQKAARLTGEAYKSADSAFRADTSSVAQKANSGQSPSVLEQAKPVLDAVSAGTSPIKGVADATFGDKPVHLPPKVFGVDVPEWAQNINRNGLTGGDIAQLAIPVLGELNAARTLTKAATAAGVTTQTMRNTLAASRGVTAAPVAPTVNSLAAKVDQFDQAQVRPSLAATQGKGAATVANVVAENPIAGVRTRAALKGATQDVADSAQRIGGQYGQARGPQMAGEGVQGGVETFASDKAAPTSFAAKTGALYDKAFNDLDVAMAGKTDKPRLATVADDHGTYTVPIGGSQIATPSTTAALGDMGQAQSKAIGELIKDPTVSKISAALTDANQAKDMSFQDLRNLRTKVRLAQDNDQLRQDIGAANLKRLEGSLTQDIYANAEKLGSPTLVRQLQRADQYYAAGSQRIQTALQPFADAKSGESAYQRVLNAARSGASADVRSLVSLKRSLAPGEWGDVSATLINEMGKPAAGAADANSAGAFSVNNFVTNYAKLSDQGKNVLFGALAGGGEKAAKLKAELDNLVQVAGYVKGVEKGANASKSAVNVQTAASMAGLINPATTIPTAKVLLLEGLTGEAMTNPAVVRWIARLGQAQDRPAALSSAVGRLQAAAKTNASLAPLAVQAQKLLAQPRPVPAAADTSQGQ